jgi:hypothetical protein
MSINIHPVLAKWILHYNPFNRLLVMCKGYDEDYENFTELVWEDDKDMDFSDKDSYPQFQIWLI